MINVKRVVVKNNRVMRDLIATGVQPDSSHNLVYHGGKTISNLTFVNFYLGLPQQWTQSDIANIDSAISKAMLDTGLSAIIAQYFKTPIFAQRSEHMLGTTNVGLTGKTQYSQYDVEKQLGDWYTAGLLGGPTFDFTSTCFNFILPPGIILTTDTTPGQTAERAILKVDSQDSSLQGLGGYHGSIHPAAGVTLYYAIAVYSQVLPGGQENGIAFYADAWKNVVVTLYHELNEVRTDADVEDAINQNNDNLLGWVDKDGDEIGDYPIFEVGPALDEVIKDIELSDGSGSVPVQLMWSNMDAGPGLPPLPLPTPTSPPPAPVPQPSPVQPHSFLWALLQAIWAAIVRFCAGK